MFGLLGWLFGASFISAIASWLVVQIYNALIPEITAATAAVRGALYTAVWGAVTGGVGMLGFKRKVRKWRRFSLPINKKD